MSCFLGHGPPCAAQHLSTRPPTQDPPVRDPPLCCVVCRCCCVALCCVVWFCVWWVWCVGAMCDQDSRFGRPGPPFCAGKDRLWPIPFWPSWFDQFWPIQFWPIHFLPSWFFFNTTPMTLRCTKQHNTHRFKWRRARAHIFSLARTSDLFNHESRPHQYKFFSVYAAKHFPAILATCHFFVDLIITQAD